MPRSLEEVSAAAHRPGAVGRVYRPVLGAALRVVAMAGFATVAALVKWCGERHVSVMEIFFFRNLFAFLLVCSYIWPTTGFGAVRTKRPGALLIATAAALTGMLGGFFAVQILPLTEATALQFAAPLLMTALSAVLLREQVGADRWVAVIVGFMGVLIMVRPNGAGVNMTGVGFALLSALGTAGAMVEIRQISGTEQGTTIVFYFTLAGTVVGLLATPIQSWTLLDTTILVALIFAGIVGGLAQLLLTKALTIAPVGLVAPFDYTQLIWAALIGLLVWREIPTPAGVVGALVVAGSGLYILYRELVRHRTNAMARDRRDLPPA